MAGAPARMEVFRPDSLVQALALAQDEGSRLVAGGTAMQLEWAQGAPQPRRLIALTRIADLRGIAVCGDHLRIGALTPLATLERDEMVRARLALLVAAVRATAGPSVRGLATIGGNVAGRKGCLLPALLALGARVETASAGMRGVRPLETWLQAGPVAGELIEAVVVPLPAGDVRWTHRKIGLRAAFTPSVIGVAALLHMADGRVTAARLATGGGIVPPARLRAAEALITGAVLDEIDHAGLHAALLREISAADDAFRSGAYRRRVAANALVHGLGRWLPDRASTVVASSRTAAIGGSEPNDTTQAGPVSSESAPAIRLSRSTLTERWHVRPDGPAKVEGRLHYMTDHREAGMLVGRILRAGVPHARILSIDTAAAEALPGVMAVVTHRDIAGQNAFGIVIQDQPALCHDKVRHAGDAVAAVAAVDADTAARALALIDVRYAPLSVVGDPGAALLDDAAAVHRSGNLLRRECFSRGDIARGFDAAAHVVEACYVTPRQMHGFMETEGGYAVVGEDGILHVFAGGQHGGRDRRQLSRILAMPEDKIRVVTSPTGGAFGGKDELTVQPALALLAIKSGRPVRMQLDRAESTIAGIKRNPMTIRMRTGCDAHGRLVAQQVELLADAGAYASLGPGVLDTALEHVSGPYDVPHVRTQGRLVYTNNGVCGAFRGFGANQMMFAVECQMDRLAKACGLDRFEIRRRNLRRAGTPGHFGQRVAPTERLREMLEAAAADPIWRCARGVSDDGSDIVGVGMALNYQGNGLGSALSDPAGGVLRLSQDGMIEALYGLDEMGQGLLAAVQGAVAMALGCGRGDVRPVTGDTARAPDAGPTTASRGTYVVWRVAGEAAPALARQIVAAAARSLGCAPDTLTITAGGIAERGSNSGALLMTFAELAAGLRPEELPRAESRFEFPKSEHTANNARLIHAFGATLARVAVSRITGQVRVLDLHQHTAAGPMLDPAAYLGQIEGGSVQGVGFTLSEDTMMRNGAFVTANLDTYMLPTIADAPGAMTVFAREDLDPGDPYGPRGAGELGIGTVTPAIANAVADAIGVWPTRTPFDPSEILEALAYPVARCRQEEWMP